MGQRLLSWGVPAALFRHVKRQTFIFISDALKTNDTLFRELSKVVQSCMLQPESPISEDNRPKTAALQIHCNIHQVSLTRRTLVLGFDGYWSSLVRLGHLFEGHSFRQRFQASLVQIVRESFRYMQCSELPPEAATWRQQAIQQLRLHSNDGPAKLSKRLLNIQRHMTKDNGDPRQATMTHWCLGASCCPGGEQEALSFLINSFSRMFEYTCVPLLYRWKHAAKANAFVRDGFFWHGILPRTLQNLPNMKGRMMHMAQSFVRNFDIHLFVCNV